MKFKFCALEKVQPHIEGACLASVEIVGHMNERQRLDAFAELWEYIGDDAMIQHLKLEGFEVRRIEEGSTGNTGVEK